MTGLDLEAERARQQQSYLTEQIQSLGARSAQFVSDQAAITERSQFISQETARLREELRHIEQEINSESRTLADEENRHREQAQSDAQSERKLEEARKIVYDCVTNLERWRQVKRRRIRTRQDPGPGRARAIREVDRRGRDNLNQAAGIRRFHVGGF